MTADPRDRALTENHTFSIAMPVQFDVLTYRSTEKPNTWIVKAMIVARDVSAAPGDDRVGYYGAEVALVNPTMRDVWDVAMTMMAHEIEEQLGLNPHVHGTVNDGSRLGSKLAYPPAPTPGTGAAET